MSTLTETRPGGAPAPDLKRPRAARGSWRTMTPRTAGKVVHWLAILVCGLILAFPLLYLLSSSLMSSADVVAYPPHLVPPSVHFGNFSEAWHYLGGRTVANSFIFAFGVVLLQLVIGLPAGFALAKIPFKGAAIITGLFVVPMFLPNNISIIPMFVVTRSLGIVNSYLGLIIPIAGSTAFATLLFRQFFSTLPDGLLDAAKLDGAGWWRILLQIITPTAGPPIAAFSSVTFLTAWNQYIWPLIVAPSSDLRVGPVALAPLAQGFVTNITPNVNMAASLISVLPVLLIFIVAQKWFVNGVVGSGLE
ncbi:carbohydrate ABC transporter permease [Streptomyces sp. NPDC049954]|uniref:carbohydrate ABC transporter permease n=1 Tax=Streptomyces sp. NPDC049954 TaxID=3155779 RepID=UPI00343B73B9